MDGEEAVSIDFSYKKTGIAEKGINESIGERDPGKVL